MASSEVVVVTGASAGVGRATVRAFARAGIRQDDVIVAFDGKPVEDGNSLRNRVASSAPGTKATLTIIRDKREEQIAITLGEYQPRQAKNQRAPE